MNNNKVIALVVGGLIALFALSLVVRFVLLNQTGVSGFFYLPIGGIGVVILLRLLLGLLNSGQRRGGTIQHWQQPSGVQAPPPPAAYPPPPAYQPPPGYQPPAPSVTQRLQELETLRASGAISETEYTAKRQQIISNL